MGDDIIFTMMLFISIISAFMLFFTLFFYKRLAGQYALLQQKNGEMETQHKTLLADKHLLEGQLQHINQNQHFLENVKKDIIEQTQLAALKSSETLSQKIYDDHQKNAHQLQEKQKSYMQEATAHLSKQFDTVQELVQQFGGRLAHQETTVQTIEKLLSTGQKIGQASETILANTLRAFALKEDIDFKLQYSMHDDERNHLKPDAVVFLPNNQYLVIDSKASSHFYDLASAEAKKDIEEIKNCEKKIKESMHAHLRNLKKKKYREELLYQLLQTHVSDPIVIMVMWLPSEQSIEKLQLIDPSFAAIAAQEKIYLASTHSLWALIGVAAQHIFNMKKNENQEHIMRETSILLTQIESMISNTEKFGTSLKRTVQQYEKFTRHMNSKIIPTSKNIAGLGIDGGKGDYTPIKSLSEYVDDESA